MRICLDCRKLETDECPFAGDEVCDEFEEESEKKTVGELKEIPFPECGSQCSFMEMMGVGECESACPEKFDKNGDWE